MKHDLFSLLQRASSTNISNFKISFYKVQLPEVVKCTEIG